MSYTSPWDFLGKPAHVVFLEKAKKDLWTSPLQVPHVDMQDADAIWDYLIERNLIGVKIVSVPSEESPSNEVNKYFVTQIGEQLLAMYRTRDATNTVKKSKFWRGR